MILVPEEAARGGPAAKGGYSLPQVAPTRNSGVKIKRRERPMEASERAVQARENVWLYILENKTGYFSGRKTEKWISMNLNGLREDRKREKLKNEKN